MPSQVAKVGDVTLLSADKRNLLDGKGNANAGLVDRKQDSGDPQSRLSAGAKDDIKQADATANAQIATSSQLGNGFYFGLTLWAVALAYIGYEWVELAEYRVHSPATAAADWSAAISWQFAATMTLFYLLFVTLVPGFITRAYGGKFLQDFMLSYNFFQVVLNTVWCALTMGWILLNNQTFLGASLDNTEAGLFLAFSIWIHYMNKYVELLDTVFMVIRNKANQQLSFLHMYHHVLMIWAWWIVCHNWNGGDAWLGGWVNSFIHILMYTYYSMAALKMNCWYKSHLTKCQLLQFCFCWSHAFAAAFVVESVPVWVCGVQLWVMSSLLVLFGKFYMQKYSSKGSSAKGSSGEKSVGDKKA